MLFLTDVSFIESALRGLCAFLCEFIYMIMSWVWSLLLNVSKVRLLTGTCKVGGQLKTEITKEAMCLAVGGTYTESAITMIYKRVTLLLGIIMTFYIIIQFIKYLMTPEEIEDKDKGIEKLGFKLLTVVVLLAFTPTIFDKAYDVQSIIIDKQILSKVILGKQGMEGSQFGRSFSASLLSNFYYAEGFPPGTEEIDAESPNTCKGLPCNDYVSMNLSIFKVTGSLSGFSSGINEHGDSGEQYYIHFDGLFALGVGIFITYMLLMYTIDVGARIIQFTFLQVIAPIPIITYLSPKKDGTFQKWLKQCWVTYLDLFIRLSILYFVTLLISALSNAHQNGTLLPNISDSSLKFFIYIVLILGLMMFCKKAPKMVEELFPSLGTASGTFGLKPGARVDKKVVETAKRATGAAIAGGAGALIGFGSGIAQGLRAGKRNGLAGFGRAVEGGLLGAIGGTARGVHNGSKKGNMVKNIGTGIRNQTAANRRFGNRAESGYKWRDQIRDSASQAFNMPTRKEKLEKDKAAISNHKKLMELGMEMNKTNRSDAEKKVREGKGRLSAQALAAEARANSFKNDERNIKQSYINNETRKAFDTNSDRKSMVDATANRLFNSNNGRERYIKSQLSSIDVNDGKMRDYKSESLKKALESGDVSQSKKDFFEKQDNKTKNDLRKRIKTLHRDYTDDQVEEMASELYCKEHTQDFERDFYNKNKNKVDQAAIEAYYRDNQASIDQKALEEFKKDYYQQIEEDAYKEFYAQHKDDQDIIDKANDKFAKDAQKAATDADKALQDAINDYQDYGDVDGNKYQGILNRKQQYINELNAYKNAYELDSDTEKEIDQIIKNVENFTASQFDDFAKSKKGIVGLSAKIANDDGKLTEKESELTKLKNETEGSGIPGGKK